MTLTKIKKDMKKLSDPERAKQCQRFFKTGKGQYGEGDIFIGLTNPQIRGIVKQYWELSLTDTQKLIKSKIHEQRLVAILILVTKFQKIGKNKKISKEEKTKQQKQIVNIYLKNTKYVNNWDLIDLSAPKILGAYLFSLTKNVDREKKILYKLAKSKSLWEKRIAMLSTFEFIRNGHFDDAINIAEILVNDKHDLIHKAVGWMLREIGKRDQAVEEKFLKRHYKTMPRTMLRYAIERFDEKKRKFYKVK